MKSQPSMKLHKFILFLEQNGFVLVRASKHYLYQHTKSGTFMTVPGHSGDVGKLYIQKANKILEKSCING